MDNKQEFLKHLAALNKKQGYIDMCGELLDELHISLNGEPPTPESIGAFVKGRWSGYVQRDRDAYQVLNDYADFCKSVSPEFADAYQEHVCETFEGEARKAVCTYKNAIAYIPDDIKIDPFFLDALTEKEFIAAFRAFQELIYDIYFEIERGSPFEWGWPDWKALTVDGIDHNRVMKVFEALAGSGRLSGDALLVDKKRFGSYDICKPFAKVKMTLKGFTHIGFCFEGLDSKKSPIFTVSYPDTPHLIKVMTAYFEERYRPCVKNCPHKCQPSWNCSNRRINPYLDFSYRFVENQTRQTRETLFLAMTDGEPPQLREIYYWHYDEAARYGFLPMSCKHMGCYSYKKGTKEWLLLGRGSSYHESEFLHSVSYAMAAKARFHKVFQTHPEKIAILMERFPDTFGRPWTECHKCKPDAEACKNRIAFKNGQQGYQHCAKHYLYFHDPSFDDVKAICQLFKLENDIKPIADEVLNHKN